MRFAGRFEGASGIGSISWRGGCRGISRGRSGGAPERATGRAFGCGRIPGGKMAASELERTRCASGAQFAAPLNARHDPGKRLKPPADHDLLVDARPAQCIQCSEPGSGRPWAVVVSGASRSSVCRRWAVADLPSVMAGNSGLIESHLRSARSAMQPDFRLATSMIPSFLGGNFQLSTVRLAGKSHAKPSPAAERKTEWILGVPDGST